MKQIKQFLFLAMALFAWGNAHAQIPVTDGASIAKQVANQLETIQKWGLQYAQMIQQIDQAKKQFESMNGARGLGTVSNSQAVKFDSIIPDSWQTLSGQSLPGYKSARSKYPTTTDKQPKLSALFDTRASQEAQMSAIYDATTKRRQQVDSLMAQIDTATDPAAKADLMNRLVQEQNAIQASAQSLAALKEKQAHELSDARQAAVTESMCLEFNKSGC